MGNEAQHAITHISVIHINILTLIGLALFGGMIGGRLFQKLRIPQVVGYIIIGIIIGRSGFKIIDVDIIKALRPFSFFALGLIGFLVGGELKREVFAKYGKQFIPILLWEGLTPFVFVTLGAGIIGTVFMGSSPFVWGLALLMGAIASATDPASTTSVLKEYRTRGPLTSTILGIVALDDGLALLLFAVSSTIAGIIMGNGAGLLVSILHSLYEIIGAFIIGGLSGLALNMVLRTQTEKEKILVFSLGTVLLVTGLALALKVSMLLSVMSLGVIVVNLRPQKSKDIFNLIEGITPPIYILFFVLVGAKLEFHHITRLIIFFIFTYLICGLTGKMIGASIGSRLCKARINVIKYLPFALYSQAGVAIGLSILAAQHFSGEIGNMLVVIITATTFITQLIGPVFTKFSVFKAGEAGLDVTEDDIVAKSKVEDFMDKNPPAINENMDLDSILTFFSDHDELYYPVVNKNGLFKGIITIERVKQMFKEHDLGGLVLAHDLMRAPIAKVPPHTSLSEVRELFNRHDCECLPVLTNDNRLEGFIERKRLNKFISTKVIELQKKLDSLE